MPLGPHDLFLTLQGRNANLLQQYHHRKIAMSNARSGHATVSLGASKDIAQRFVDEGRFESISEACRAGLQRLNQDSRVIDQLAELGKQGMASGIATDFDIGHFIDET